MRRSCVGMGCLRLHLRLRSSLLRRQRERRNRDGESRTAQACAGKAVRMSEKI
jgi:hypothetical protein